MQCSKYEHLMVALDVIVVMAILTSRLIAGLEFST